MKRNNKKGFTLAELLVVVAIIAVLIAVAIPILTNDLERSRDAVSLANLRSAYADAMVEMLNEDTTNVTIDNVQLFGSQPGIEESIDTSDLPFSIDSEYLKAIEDGIFSVTFNADNPDEVVCTLDRIS